MHRICRFLATLAIAVFAAGTVHAATVYTDDGVAIGGYDPVAYFNAGKPVEGSSEHALEWSGVTWRFASAANRDAFAAEPGKYAPQYGGFCAWAVSQGYTAPVDPDAWKIVDGKLYLNYSKGVQANWEKGIPGHIRAADGNWPGIRDKLAR
ncbi:MAG: YHS domain-containing (seleno)protein [Acetobacterales bacterium]